MLFVEKKTNSQFRLTDFMPLVFSTPLENIRKPEVF